MQLSYESIPIADEVARQDRTGIERAFGLPTAAPGSKGHGAGGSGADLARPEAACSQLGA